MEVSYITMSERGESLSVKMDEATVSAMTDMMS